MLDSIKEMIIGLLVIIAATITSVNSDTISNENLDLIQNYQVIKVIDGDTIEVFIDGKIEKVRMIGINTPETVDPRRPVQCYGKEASNKLKELLQDKIIVLEADETQDSYDKYNRALRYVFLNEENINKKMVSEGFAFEYTYKKPYKFQKDFKEAERKAQENNIGLWNDEVCNY
jgi:micrococcal nuclease